MVRKQLPRRDARFSVQKAIPAEITITDGQDARVAHGRVLDISLRGARLELEEPLSDSEHRSIQIELAPNELDTTITATGSTCWARPVYDNAWWLGISFDEAMDESQVDELAKHGYLDRRKDRREAADMGLLARCELSDEPITIKLRDLSVGGLGIWSPRALVPESRLLVGVSERSLDSRPVVARVKWVTEADDGFVVGCSFIAKEGYPELRRQVANQLDGTWRRRQETVRYMLGLLAGVATLVLGFHWLTQF
jgi:c-di-GMP-binding flagellar brake protein YcgR